MRRLIWNLLVAHTTLLTISCRGSNEKFSGRLFRQYLNLCCLLFYLIKAKQQVKLVSFGLYIKFQIIVNFSFQMVIYFISTALWKPFCAHITKHHNKQSELPQPIPWNQTSDVHRGSTLITWRWRHRNHANTIASLIAEKQMVTTVHNVL